jgi:hypothetical protein
LLFSHLRLSAFICGERFAFPIHRSPDSNQFLELADIALGLKKPAPKKKRHGIHDKSKTEPYTQK